MTEWVLLIAIYVIDGESIESRILLPDYPSCSQTIEPLYEALSSSYDDLAVMCKGTGILSSTLRPVARPEGLNQ